MPTPPELDQMPVRAARAAVLGLGRDFGALTPWQSIYIACVAVWREGQNIRSLSLAEQEERLTQSAQLALAEARVTAEDDRSAARRAILLGSIEHLPQSQQMVLSLRIEHDMSDREIAVVLGCTDSDVIVLTTAALDTLRTHPPLRLVA